MRHPFVRAGVSDRNSVSYASPTVPAVDAVTTLGVGPQGLMLMTGRTGYKVYDYTTGTTTNISNKADTVATEHTIIWDDVYGFIIFGGSTTTSGATPYDAFWYSQNAGTPSKSAAELATGTWTALPMVMPEGKIYVGTARIPGTRKWMLFGGQSGGTPTYNRNVWLVDFAAGTLTVKPNAPVVIHGAASAVSIPNSTKMMVFTPSQLTGNPDSSNDTVYYYDTASEIWTLAPSLPALKYQARAVFDGVNTITVFTMGDRFYSTSSAGVYQFNLTTNTWSTLSNPAAPWRGALSAVHIPLYGSIALQYYNAFYGDTVPSTVPMTILTITNTWATPSLTYYT